MKKILIVTALVAAASVTSACATKRYPIATQWSSAEAEAMDCNDLRLELIRANQVQTQIAETADFDWRSVAGFLGDYGIGNAMAKSDADKAIRARIQGIQEAQRATVHRLTSDNQNEERRLQPGPPFPILRRVIGSLPDQG